MPILMKKVLKLWCENIQEGGGGYVYSRVQSSRQTKTQRIGRGLEVGRHQCHCHQEIVSRPQRGHFCRDKEKVRLQYKLFIKSRPEKKVVFDVFSSKSFFLLSYYPTERIGLFLPSNSILFLQCLLLRSLVLFMFSIVIQFKKERNLFCK